MLNTILVIVAYIIVEWRVASLVRYEVKKAEDRAQKKLEAIIELNNLRTPE